MATARKSPLPDDGRRPPPPRPAPGRPPAAILPFGEPGRDAGADIALELTDTDYGSRDFTVRDPEGTLWAFGTYRPAA